MTRAILLQRQLSLGAAAVLAAVVGLAVAGWERDREQSEARLPPPAVAARSDWYRALATVRTRPIGGRQSACGNRLSVRSLGLGHPVLPCGTKLYVSFGGRTVLTQVIDRGPLGPGAEFELTPALAGAIGLSGTRELRWTFARAS